MLKYKFVIVLLFFLEACNVGQKQNTADKKQLDRIVYAPTLISNQLPDEVNEQSGLICDTEMFWVNNDSDCKPEIYAYNAKGDLLQTVIISDKVNNDWEDLTCDSAYFYIGDFGNNFGDRKNLQILRLKRSELNGSKLSKIHADKIGFEWEDQKDFTHRRQNHNYDCEAFFSYRDSLYLFSKNWADLETRMYVMSKNTNYQKLSVKASFNSDLMITGADISKDGKCVALIGYKNFKTSLILLYDFQAPNFFGGKKLRLELSSLGSAQTEGVAFNAKNELFINSEETSQKQAIYSIDWKKFIK